MGLDMTLYVEKTIFEGFADNKDPNFSALTKLIGVEPEEFSRFVTVQIPVGYWRKVNQVHKWFVDNVQGGKDDCNAYPVQRNQLVELKSLCLRILSCETPVEYFNLAKSTLPTQSGFFFGSTEYDEYYVNGLRRTVAIIDRILSDDSLKDLRIFYRSSW